EEPRDYMQRFLKHWQENGFGMWLLYDRDQHFVGRTALRRMELDGQTEVEVGCALLAPFWNKGLASEIVRALVDLAFVRLGLSNVVGFALPSNVASICILQKLRFRYEKDIVHAERRHVLYRLTREEFPAATK
ncbi:MAG TPA: GNAT family N-acetyltransferase, partial [Terriglobales bacterium]|nr:GNAT family N-acetyltransferase [Terriglobales bacterium]